MDVLNQLRRVPGRSYSSEHSLVPRDHEFIRDVKGYYKILGIDPNRGRVQHEQIKSNFRKLIKLAHNTDLQDIVGRLIESWVVLSDPIRRYQYDKQRVDWDSVDLDKVILKELTKEDPPQDYAYFTETGEVSSERVQEWLLYLSLAYHHRGSSTLVRIGFTGDSWRIDKYSFGEVIVIPERLQPSQEMANYFISRLGGDRWYLDLCKISYLQ